ncbi:MAG: exodeoxyribonuclease III [Actinomycetales bacterium]
MRLATFNCNGIRAAMRRGLDAWLHTADPDVLALQEVRCPVEALPSFASDLHLRYDPGRLAGRNGVAVLTRDSPTAVRTWGADVYCRAPGSDHVDLVAAEPGDSLARGLRAFADEGRYLEVDLAECPVTVGCLYLPKGGLPAELQRPGRMRDAPDGGAKYQRKMRFLDAFARQLETTRRAALRAGREFVLVGDLNIAHTRWDVARWRASQRSEGFLPEERAWYTSILGTRKLIDVARAQAGDTPGPYTWWSWLGTSYERDLGWRIDVQLATPALARSARSVRVDRGERMSDHAPVMVEYAT